MIRRRAIHKQEQDFVIVDKNTVGINTYTYTALTYLYNNGYMKDSTKLTK